MTCKRTIVLRAAVLLLAYKAALADGEEKPLDSIQFDLTNAPSIQPATYDWRAIYQSAGKSESKEYATIVLLTKLKNGNATFHDKITLAPKAIPDAPPGFIWIFDRVIVFDRTNLFVPQTITIDMNLAGQAIHQFDYKNGVAKYVDESTGPGTRKLDLSQGILTDNALLRILPLLPRTVGDVYTFRSYAEPLLFLVHDADKTDPNFTLTCQSLQALEIGGHKRDCCKFEMILKSASIKSEFWVDTARNIVARYSDVLPDPGSPLMEATLQN